MKLSTSKPTFSLLDEYMGMIINPTCPYCEKTVRLVNYDNGEVFVAAVCDFCNMSWWGFAEDVFKLLVVFAPRIVDPFEI